jgi:glycosyltransferase involved in cell wall biosynthesis
MKEKKIALVADWLTDRGGAEHVVEAMAKTFPEAKIFTSVYHKDNFPALKKRIIHTTFLQKLPNFLRKKHQFLLPFFPFAFRLLDLDNYDIILSSSSSGFSKCVRKTRKNQIHICYCHTPIRFLYHARDEYMTDYPIPWWLKPLKIFLPFLLNYLTRIDQNAATNVDYFLSNSDFVGKRIRNFYGKNSQTIYPCIDTKPFINAGTKFQKSKHFNAKNKEKYFLSVGRFIPYKKFDLLVQTFIKNKLPLKLVGSGPELEKCKYLVQSAKAKNIEFLGFVSRDRLPDIFAQARAFVFPVEEDFGLTPVEAMSAGIPVIYYQKGGATESVGKWGIGFKKQNIKELQKGIDDFLEKEERFSKKVLSERGKIFDEKIFRKKLQDFIESIL